MADMVPSITLDAETRALESPRDHTSELRLWLRMLTCTNMIEAEIRRRLRERFDVTLPRFDLMAQLDKTPDGLSLGEISRRMMVSNGNVTGLVERLAEDGLVERRASDTDRRSTFVRLTDEGRAAFAEMAAEHAGWVGELFGALSSNDIDILLDRLSRTKASVENQSSKGEGSR